MEHLLWQNFIVQKQIDRLRNVALYYRRKSRRERRRARMLSQILMMKGGRDRTIWCVNRTGTFWETEVPLYNDNEFKRNFRVSRSTLDFLVGRLYQGLVRQHTQYRDPISVPKRIAVALYTLGSSAEYRTIASIFGIGESTVGQLLLEFCQVIKVFEPEFIKFYPPTEDKIIEMRLGFEEVWGFPQCYGAIDGCHIEVKVNDEDKVDYHNYKGCYSIVLLAAVDYRYRFTYVNIGSPGRNNDSHIFERSIIRRLHSEDNIFQNFSKDIEGVQVPILLLGDSAFRLDRFLMKPFPHDNLTPKEKHFNYMLSRARRVTENAFGQVKNRFRRIGNGLELMLENDSIVIRASCILHNILNERNDYLNEEFNSGDSERLRRNREQPTQATMQAPTGDGIAVRNAIADYLWARDRRLDENDD